ncbi:MAG: hypothetical protein WCW52_01855 [Elusimicrobiales bacterium]|jgi:hypothetical protein
MKVTAIIVCLLGLAVGVNAETGTIETLTKPLTAAGIDNSDGALDKMVQDKLKAMYEEGNDVSLNELSGSLPAIKYDLQGGLVGTLSLVETKTNSFTVAWNIPEDHLNEYDYNGSVSDVSGKGSIDVKTDHVTLGVRKTEADGKTYQILKYSYDSCFSCSAPDYDTYALIVK